MKEKIQEETEAKTVIAKPAKKRSVLQKFNSPILHQVATKIVADDEKFIPQYQTDDAACADLVANITQPLQICSRGIAVVDCGFSLELKSGYKACIVARSGLAKKGLIVANSPGQIDPDYRNRVGVILVNIGKEIIVVNPGDRVAQIYIEPIYKFDWVSCKQEDLSPSNRNGGFGSTGVN